MPHLLEIETGRILVARLEMADTFWKRAWGLLGSAPLAPDQGLWLSPCNGVHTLFMHFPLDLLFLDKNGLAIYQRVHLPPWRVCGPIRGAKSVVELPAGFLKTHPVLPDSHYRPAES